jgi:WhiB family redox-sensing transcriptional regulator
MAITDIRAGVPGDWFVDPVRLGVPGVRKQTPIEDEEALAWQEDALCAQTDPEAFFPEKGGSTREAKKICTSCEVRAQCLQYALQNDERFGIWGGLSERERRKLRKQAS